MTKKLQKLGNSRILLIDRDLLHLLGLTNDDEPEVSVRIYGDTMVVRRADAEPLNLQQVGAALGLEPWDAVALPQQLDFGDVLKALREVLELLEGSPHTPQEICELLDLSLPAVSTRLARARKLNYVYKEGNLYHLNREMFEPVQDPQLTG